VREAWEKFTSVGIGIELPPLKTREERLKFLGSVGWAPVVPLTATRRLQQLIDEERVDFGLPKMYEGSR